MFQTSFQTLILQLKSPPVLKRTYYIHYGGKGVSRMNSWLGIRQGRWRRVTWPRRCGVSREGGAGVTHFPCVGDRGRPSGLHRPNKRSFVRTQLKKAALA